MEDLDRYIIEATRVRRAIVVYSEMFGTAESVNTLNKSAGEAFSIIQRAMHDEIVMSLSRLFDSKGYENKGEVLEYLSQYNMVSMYEAHLNDRSKKLRKLTGKIINKLAFKPYRNLKIAHNDKAQLLGATTTVKHNITSSRVLLLIDLSLNLMISIKASKLNSTAVSVPVNLSNKYVGVGSSVVNKMKI
ncbi:AbiU2 domain-containing protein [Vibrio sp. Hal054]|uniref:AbiU2 domain-containing protein n=1 Tax=Vibrio sp. Hal054 TaxID=3035158 RepID=UPI00301B8CC5